MRDDQFLLLLAVVLFGFGGVLINPWIAYGGWLSLVLWQLGGAGWWYVTEWRKWL